MKLLSFFLAACLAATVQAQVTQIDEDFESVDPCTSGEWTCMGNSDDLTRFKDKLRVLAFGTETGYLCLWPVSADGPGMVWARDSPSCSCPRIAARSGSC